MKFPNKWFYLTVIITILLVLSEYYPAIFKGYYIYEDNTIYGYSMHKFYEKDLFPYLNNFIHFVSAFNPPGVNFLFLILSKVMTPYAITIFLAFFSALITNIFLYKATVFFTSKGWLRFLTCFLFMLLYLSSQLGGHAHMVRALGFCFITAFVYFLLKGERNKTYIVTVASCWFYPSLIGICFLSSFFDLIFNFYHNKDGGRDVNREMAFNFLLFTIILIAGVLIIITHNSAFPFHENYKGHFTAKEMAEMPEFGDEGCIEPTSRLIKDKKYLLSLPFVYEMLLFIDGNYDKGKTKVWPIFFILILIIISIFKWQEADHAGKKEKLFIYSLIISIFFGIITIKMCVVSPYGALIWFLVLLTGIFCVLIGGKAALKLQRGIWYLFIASVLMFILIYSMPFNIAVVLRYPARQLGYVLPLFLVFVFCYNIDHLSNKRIKIMLRYLVSIPAALFGIVFLIYSNNSALDHAKDKELYNYLLNLPRDILVAGHPDQMDFIPFFAKREVLSSTGLMHPAGMGVKFWLKYKERNFDLFNALYAHNQEEFTEFCKKYKNRCIYFIVDKFYFSDKYLINEKLYYEPFNKHIKEITKNRNFFLNNIPDEKKIFEQDNVFVVNCSDFK